MVVSGSVVFEEVSSTVQAISWSLSGVDTACTTGATGSNVCGMGVHIGTSCSDNAFGHLYSGVQTPWMDLVYTSDANGLAVGSMTLDTEMTIDELAGHTLIVFDSGLSYRVACSILATVQPPPPAAPPLPPSLPPPPSPPPPVTALHVASFVSHIFYTGSHPVPSGTFTVFSAGATSQSFVYNLLIGSSECSGGATGSHNSCQWHVHEGTSCTDGMGGPHLYSGSTNPWNANTYAIDEDTRASGTVQIDTGLALADLLGHTVMVHDVNGQRIACGVLSSGTGGRRQRTL
jgi:hypothetical protein